MSERLLPTEREQFGQPVSKFAAAVQVLGGYGYTTGFAPNASTATLV